MLPANTDCTVLGIDSENGTFRFSHRDAQELKFNKCQSPLSNDNSNFGLGIINLLDSGVLKLCAEEETELSK